MIFIYTYGRISSPFFKIQITYKEFPTEIQTGKQDRLSNYFVMLLIADLGQSCSVIRSGVSA